jgi:hypothetical protein
VVAGVAGRVGTVEFEYRPNTSTFSSDIAYSSSPAASRAFDWLA